MISLFLSDPVSYVRNGGSTRLANVSPDHPIWIHFANAMAPYARANAKRVAAHVAAFSKPPCTVLDIAAGPGLYGIEVARAIPGALITAVDWAPVLTVAKANADAAGVADRFRMVPGSAKDLDWGCEFDLILLPNILHLFDFDTCVSLLRKAKLSLAADGQALGVDFVPNEDQISPPIPAMFAFWMLATTPGGDAYTERQLDEMARKAGFRGVTTRPLGKAPDRLLIFQN
jgi:cyclopropane fatty-acyl-phospholipid synthase-like methyltransferase